MFARLGHTTLLAVLVVCIAASTPFLSTLDAYFLGDDFGLIHLFSQKSPTHWLTLFTSPWTESIFGGRADELRPLLALTYQVDWMVGGARPQAYHVSSIVLHVLNSLLVYAMARRIAGLGVVSSAFAGSLFGVMGVHAETVAWISGRADSIPALFYLSTVVAYVQWRRGSRSWYYWASLAAFFLALFSKQSAITMLATLLTYDWLIEGRWPWRCNIRDLAVYLPFALLTAGYLGLRFILFGNFVREQQITPDTLTAFLDRQRYYLQMLGGGLETLALGGPDRHLGGLALSIGMFLLLGAAGYGAYRASTRLPGRAPAGWGPLLFLGPLWWAITVAPLAVTYLSARHLYLASAGAAVVLALGCHALWGLRSRLFHATGILLGAGVVAGQLLVLVWGVEQWNAAGRLSERITRDLELEALTAPEGSLILLGAPAGVSTTWSWAWSWAWALPFALEPPFMAPGVGGRVAVVSRPEVYCCPLQWRPYVRNALLGWLDRPEQPPIVALAWELHSGDLIRRGELEDPGLRVRTLRFLEAESTEDMGSGMGALLRPLGGTGARFR